MQSWPACRRRHEPSASFMAPSRLDDAPIQDLPDAPPEALVQHDDVAAGRAAGHVRRVGNRLRATCGRRPGRGRRPVCGRDSGPQPG
ncbi:hypothetical protein LUTEI9C_60175 [Luteimonas sp. 9C]|nr:hypothetical protein LUTEI9C_60175 [Luteimonas sp. 9C]